MADERQLKRLRKGVRHWNTWRNKSSVEVNLTEANLYGADLRGAQLSGADLRHADLRETELNDANLYKADLSGASLIGANLTRANLVSASFTGDCLIQANLSGADLREADFRRTDLWGADLRNANIHKANLSMSVLWRANLYRANLSEAVLWKADFWKADLTESVLRNADLKEANLSLANLTGADFTKANLGETYLSKANFQLAVLTETNLTGCDLWRAILNSANLDKANLSKAYLGAAYIWGTSLRQTNLSSANLEWAELSGVIIDAANMTGSNFSGTRIHNTIFRNLDLSETLGLGNAYHYGPSTIGTDTINKSKGTISKRFLKGCGLSDWEIESAKLYNHELSNEEIDEILYKVHDLRAKQSVQISPLFISYSHADVMFVEKLENQLDKKGIRFWRDVYDAKAGRLEKQINRALRLNPTVLLILSKHSLQSDWVEHEVREARNLEKEIGRDVLCPVALDDSWKDSPWSKRLMEQVMEYNILDFSVWKDDAKFKDTFDKLIDGLELFYK